jgi:hypothetical protein
MGAVTREKKKHSHEPVGSAQNRGLRRTFILLIVIRTNCLTVFD